MRIPFAFFCTVVAFIVLTGCDEPARPTLIATSNPDAKQRAKDALRDAGIPFSTEMRDGQEFITWPRERNAAAEAVLGRMGRDPFPGKRNAQFPDPALQKQFTQWLLKKDIKHEVVKSFGQEWVVWDREAGDLVRQFMESRGADCKNRLAGVKAGAEGC